MDSREEAAVEAISDEFGAMLVELFGREQFQAPEVRARVLDNMILELATFGQAAGVARDVLAGALRRAALGLLPD